MQNFAKQTALGHFSGGRGPSSMEWPGRVTRHTQISLHKDKEASVATWFMCLIGGWTLPHSSNF